MSELSWNTGISQIKPNEIRLRGYQIDELMGNITFAQAIFLALKGELPNQKVAKLLDAMLVSSIDHGATPPSALAARTVASTGADLNGAVAAGVLSINRFHGGAIYDCMGVLLEALNRISSTKKSVEDVAAELIAEYKAEKKRIAGFGHRIHTNDPRTVKLFSLAKELGVAGKGVEMILAMQKVFEDSGKALPINVDGAIAALLVDLDMPRELANAFFIMARVPGLVAHVYEEQTTQKPMRRIHPTDHGYDGPPERSLEE
ncbi:MAG: citryl-CoA lyase [Anaerolineales bacterium]|jgi:citrate synthase